MHIPNILPPSMMTCPYPMQPLALYFVLRYLDADRAASLRMAQRQAHQSPPPSLSDEELSRPVFGGMQGHMALGMQPPWLRKGPSWLVPDPIARVTYLHLYRVHARAVSSFADAVDRVMAERGVLHPPPKNTWIFAFRPDPQYDVFAIWTGLVEPHPDLTEATFSEFYELNRHDLIGRVMKGGKEAAIEISHRICDAIETHLIKGAP